jgi:ABC-type nitrate/sulfonate/bicarbonate transport system permease component
MMATVAIIAVIGIIVLQFPKVLENRLFRWKESERISRGLGN